MKTILIQNFCTSRKKIDELATSLGISKIGSREEILSRISLQSYKSIKNAIYN